MRRLSSGSGGGHARGVLRAWRLWEVIANRLWPTQTIPGAPANIVRLRFRAYHGPSVVLPDGTRVNSGDLIGEIHLDNRKIAEATVQSRWQVIPPIQADFRALAAWTAHPDFPAGVGTFYGQTLIGRAAQIVGFTIFSRPRTLYDRLERIYMLGLLQIYSYEGGRRLTHGTQLDAMPQDTWMSRSTLLDLYGQAERTNGPVGGAPAGNGRTQSPPVDVG